MMLLAEYGHIIILLACGFGFLVAWGMGANDVANAVGPAVGSKALTIRQALLIAIIFEFLGAYFIGGAVTSTISHGMIDVSRIGTDLIVFGMLASMLATGLWLLLASINGWPVSTTHTIVGAIVGFAAVGISVDAVQWGKILAIALSWVLSPAIAGVVAFIVFRSIQSYILSADDPFDEAKRKVPYYMFLTAFVISLLIMLKGLDHFDVDLSLWQRILSGVVIALLFTLIGKVFLNKIQPIRSQKRMARFLDVERVFAILMVFAACAMAFAHGSNDVSNAVGPIAAIVNAVGSGRLDDQAASVPSWILLLGAVGLVTGMLTLGYKVIATVGQKITELTPTRGFAASLSTASTVVIGSAFGLPLSTTHTMVGAILGVGLARGFGAIDLRVVGTIFSTWVITLPAGAILSIIFFFMFKGMFLG